MKLFSRIYSITLCLFVPIQVLAVDLNKNMVVDFATEANYYPFEYLDDQQQLQGFDIDVTKAVCKVANLTCNFYNQSFDSLLLTLQFGGVDAVIASLDITQERLSKFDFSDSYYQSAPVFVGATNNKKQFSLVGKFIGVQSDSSNHHYLLEHAKKDSFIIAYPSSAKTFIDLKEGKIDVVFADQAVALNFLDQEKNNLNFSVKKTEEVFLEGFSQGYGIAVKKGNAVLLERLNYGLEMIRNDGTYQRIFNRYFDN